MAPYSYQGPSAKDSGKDRTFSQSKDSNLAGAAGSATVADILATKGRDVFSIAPGDTVKSAIGVLREKKIGALLVMDDSQLRGILSERDVVGRLDTDGAAVLELSVGDLMTADPFTCTPEDALLTILRRMTDGHYRHMPVMDEGGLAGMISIGDVVKARLRELEYEALRMRQMIVG